MKPRQITIYALLISLPLILGLSSEGPDVNSTHDSIVVAKITDITGEQYDAIEQAVTQIDALNIEYCCMWSGVMVLKLNKSHLSQLGDIHFYIKSILNQAAPLKKLEIMHVHTGLSGMAKC